jgi:hypothetical protein
MNKKNKARSKKNRSAAPTRRDKEKGTTDACFCIRELITWLKGLGYWKALLALVVLIFAWRIANHFFP